MQITLVYHDLRSFSPNAWNSPTPTPDLDQPPTTTSKPWRPPPYANLLPPNTTITTTDVSTNRRGAGAINCASIFGATTARGHAQVSEQVNDGTGGLFTSDRKDRGHVGPQKQHKRHNNQSVCGRGNAGVKNVCNNTTISRAGWIIRQKINNEFIHLGQPSRPE